MSEYLILRNRRRRITESVYFFMMPGTKARTGLIRTMGSSESGAWAVVWEAKARHSIIIYVNLIVRYHLTAFDWIQSLMKWLRFVVVWMRKLTWHQWLQVAHEKGFACALHFALQRLYNLRVLIHAKTVAYGQVHSVQKSCSKLSYSPVMMESNSINSHESMFCGYRKNTRPT